MSTTPDDSDDLRKDDELPREPPVMPTTEEAAATERPADQRPAAVRYAFVVWVLTGAFGVINAIDMLTQKQRYIDTVMQADPSDTIDEVTDRVTATLWALLVLAVTFAALFTLSAYKAQAGVRRARLILTMLCVVTVVFYFVVLPTTFGLMTALLALAATVLLYLPKSNLFFRPGDLPT